MSPGYDVLSFIPLWSLVGSNVDFADLIWEEFNYQIESRRISKRLLSFHHVIKLDSILGNIKFVNKGPKEPIFGMDIPFVMLNDDIKASAEYSEYLAKSRGVAPVKTRGKGLLTKQEVEIVVERETDEDKEPLVRTRLSGIDIGREAHRESKEERVDHSKELKGLETLSKSAQFQLHIMRERKASRHDFFIQQHPRGSGEGSGLTPEMSEEIYLNSSSSDSEFVVEEISSDEAEVTKKANNLKIIDAKKDTEDQVAEFTSKFLNDNPKITVNDVLQDPVEPKVQSMMDIPVTQEKPAEPRPPSVDTTVTLILDTTTVSPTLCSPIG
ncbi:hypothetical protein Tco_1144216 [Tanacetum coccineum]